MAYLTGLSGDASLYADHVKPAADYLVAHGPSFGNERWEEQGGYSPSTIAAEIAGLTAASHIAHVQGDPAHARLYQAVADDFQRTVKGFTVTTTVPTAPRRTSSGSPRTATRARRSTTASATAASPPTSAPSSTAASRSWSASASCPRTTPTCRTRSTVLDQQLGTTTPTGTGYYRYGTSTAGSEDGYGDCYTPDPTDCPRDGQPWPTTDTGSGHLWPVLSGERAESALATGDTALARTQLGFMLGSASGVGLVPEQAWEDPDLAASPYGSDPTTASIGFRDGHAAGSAAPLTWAQAQELRLMVNLSTGRIVDRPDLTTHRYVDQAPPGEGRRHHQLAPRRRDRRRAHHRDRHGHAGCDRRRQPGRQRHPRLRPRHRPRRRGRHRGPPTSTALFGSDAITAAATTAVRSDGRRPRRRGRRPGRRYDDPRRHRPGRRRQRAGHLPVPDLRRLQAGLLRHHPLPGAPAGRHRLPAHHPAEPRRHLRQPRRRPAARRLRPPAGRDTHQHRRGVREPQLLHRAGGRLEPAARGAGLRRPGLAGRERRPGRHRHRRRRLTGRQDDHDRPARRRSSARRPPAGRSTSCSPARTASPTAGAHLRADAAAVPVRGLRRRRHVADLLGRSRDGAEGGRRDHPGRASSQATELDPTLGPPVIHGVPVP